MKETTSFRLGTTSYILPADILPNVRHLAGQVQDVELVLFEVDDGANNLPARSVVRELATLARAHDLTYTIHLPLDLHFGASGEALDWSLAKARSVIERTCLLDPWAYVLHLDGQGIEEYEAWALQAARSLELAGEWAGDPGLLAVENLEGYPLDYLDPLLDGVGASRCIDVGHLWLDGHDPLDYMRRHMHKTRVVHLHGVGSRDHQSLALVEPGELRKVIKTLQDLDYGGVLTIEVFGQEDLDSSMAALREVGLGCPVV